MSPLLGSPPIGRSVAPPDLTRPSAARIFNCLLGDKDHYPEDQAAAQKLCAAAPSLQRSVRAGRDFVLGAVEYCARAGIRQLIDMGIGMPTRPTVADQIRRTEPGARVIGVDNDPLVLTHAVARIPGMRVVEGDVRDPVRVLDHPVMRAEIDWSQPVAVLLTATLHHLTDDEDPAGVVGVIHRRLAPGSMLVISHASCTGADPVAVRTLEDVFASADAPLVLRTQELITRLFSGLLQVPPGVSLVQDWPGCGGGRDLFPILGGIGCVPLRQEPGTRL